MNPVTASMFAIFIAALGGEITTSSETPKMERERPVLEEGSADGLVRVRPLAGTHKLLLGQTVKHTLMM